MQVGSKISFLFLHNYSLPFLLMTTLASASLLGTDVGFGREVLSVFIYATCAFFLSSALKSQSYGLKALGFGLGLAVQALSLLNLELLPFSPTSFLFPILISKVSGFHFMGIIGLLAHCLALSFSKKSLIIGVQKEETFETSILSADLRALALGLMLLIILDKRATSQYQNQISAQNQQLQALAEERDEIKKTAAENIASINLSLCTFSHELRNPLNGMGGILTLLSERVRDPAALISLKKAKLCLQIIKNLLNSVLDSGKLERGTLELNLAPVSVTEFFDGVWTVCSDLIASKGLRPIFKISKNLPKYLNIDSQRITQAILNIVSNAVKYTNSGSVSIIVSWKRTSSTFAVEDSSDDSDSSSILENTSRITFGNYRSMPKFLGDQYVTLSNENSTLSERTFTLNQPQGNVKGLLIIKIIDTGCGMNELQQERLFEKFSQVSADPQQRSNGAGLGLWITKSLIKSMGGDIHLFSKEMEGSSFELNIPAEADENYSKLSQHLGTETSLINSTETRPSHSPKKLSVAIIDSSASERLRMKQKLLYTGLALTVEEFEGEAKLGLHLNELLMGQASPFDVIIVGVEQRSLSETVACWKRLIENSSVLDDPQLIIAFGENFTANDQEKFVQPREIKKPLRMIPRSTSATEMQKILADLLKSSQKILIADDDCYNLGIMESFIKKLGYECLKASNGREAVEIFQRHSKEIGTIFFDNEMPEVNGLEAGQEINRLICSADNTDNVHMYLLTGSLDTELKKRAREIGFKEAIAKPFEYENLARLLK